jgi:hypothetical protein
VDADGLWGRAVLLEVMAGLGVHGRRRSMVSSWRKPTVGKHSPGGGWLIGGSGSRWSLHEGGWAKSFRSAQRRKREVGRWCSSMNRGGSRERSREQGGVKGVRGGKGKYVARHAPFIAVRGSG